MLGLVVLLAGISSLALGMGLSRKAQLSADRAHASFTGMFNLLKPENRIAGTMLLVLLAATIWIFASAQDAWAVLAGVTMGTGVWLASAKMFSGSKDVPTGAGQPAMGRAELSPGFSCGFLICGFSLCFIGALYQWIGWPIESWKFVSFLLGLAGCAALLCAACLPAGRAESDPLREFSLEVIVWPIVYSSAIVCVVLCGAALPAPEDSLRLWYMASGPGIAVLGLLASILGVRSMEYLGGDGEQRARRNGLVVTAGCFLGGSLVYAVLSPGYSLWLWLATSSAVLLGVVTQELCAWFESKGWHEWRAGATLVCFGLMLFVSLSVAESSEKLFSICLGGLGLTSLLPFLLGTTGLVSHRLEARDFEAVQTLDRRLFNCGAALQLSVFLGSVSLLCAMAQKTSLPVLLSASSSGIRVLIWSTIGISAVLCLRDWLFGRPESANGQDAESAGRKSLVVISLTTVLALGAILLGGLSAQAGVPLGAVGAMLVCTGAGTLAPQSRQTRAGGPALIIFIKLLCIYSLFIAPLTWERG